MANRIQTLRSRKMQLQDGQCCYCDRPMWDADPEDFRRTFGITPHLLAMLRCTAEHLIPASEGGRANAANIAAACRFCNQTRHRVKKPRSPESYRALVQRRLAKGRWLQVPGALGRHRPVGP